MKTNQSIESLIALETTLAAAIADTTNAMLAAWELEGSIADASTAAELLLTALSQLQNCRRRVAYVKAAAYAAEAQ